MIQDRPEFSRPLCCRLQGLSPMLCPSLDLSSLESGHGVRPGPLFSFAGCPHRTFLDAFFLFADRLAKEVTHVSESYRTLVTVVWILPLF